MKLTFSSELKNRAVYGAIILALTLVLSAVLYFWQNVVASVVAFSLLLSIVSWEHAGLMRRQVLQAPQGRALPPFISVLVLALLSLLAGFLFMESAWIAWIMLLISLSLWIIAALRLFLLNSRRFRRFFGGLLGYVFGRAYFKKLSLGEFVAPRYFENQTFAWFTFAIAGASGAMLLLNGQILYPVLAVVVADIGAYFAGKKWGKRKILPSASPGKSYEGFVGAVVLCSVYWFVVAMWRSDIQSYYAFALILGFITPLASTAGDLIESKIKRIAGVKDSASWIPGHGGLYDRLDGHLIFWTLYAWLYLSNWV